MTNDAAPGSGDVLAADATTTAPDVSGTTPRPSSNRKLDRSLSRRGLFGLFAVLAVAVAVASPTPYFAVGLDELARPDQPLAAHYVDQPAAIRATLLIHAATGGLALLLTPVQASRWVRRQRTALHRLSGRISAGAIALSALSGLVVAQVSYAGWSGRIGFSLLSTIWLYGIFRVVNDARIGDLAAHRRWSIRVMALTFAAVTLRLWLGVYIGASLPSSGEETQRAFDQIYAVTPFLSWVPNLLIAEWYLRRRRGPNDREFLPRAAATVR